MLILLGNWFFDFLSLVRQRFYLLFEDIVWIGYADCDLLENLSIKQLDVCLDYMLFIFRL